MARRSRSVWSRVATGSTTEVGPLAVSPASRSALFTWALGTESTWRRPCSRAPVTVSGARPSRDSILAPMVRSGSTTRAIGRRLSDASPSRVADTQLPASRPSNRRMVVPEFAQSSAPCGGLNDLQPPPWTRAGPPVRSILTPRPRRQATVAATSSPSGSPSMRLSPWAIAASIKARCAIDLSPGTRSSPATLVAGSTICADSTSVRSMRALREELAHAVAAVNAIAVVMQDLREAIDRLDEGAAISRRDVLVEGGVALGQTNHAPKPRAPQPWIRKRPHRLRVRDAQGEREVAEKRHLPVVRLGGEDLRTRADRPNEAEPFIKGGELLPLIGREHPGLSAKQRGIAFAQPAPLLAGDRVTAEKSRGVGQGTRPLEDGPLDTRHVGDDCLSRNVGGEVLEHGSDLVDRGGDQDEVGIREVEEVGWPPVARATLLRRQYPIFVMGDTAYLDGPAQPAQGQAERASDETETDDADPHHATPTVRLSAAATASTCSTRWAKACGVSDWAPSESATSGCACTSTISPSAPAAIPASAMGVTRERRPVPWLGSTITGRWLSSLISGTALRSSVLRV